LCARRKARNQLFAFCNENNGAANRTSILATATISKNNATINQQYKKTSNITNNNYHSTIHHINSEIKQKHNN
jgi:hypothetical protein